VRLLSKFLARRNPSSLPALSKEGEIRMMSIPKIEALGPDRPVQMEEEEDVFVQDYFTAYSDNGVIMASQKGTAWLSTLPGTSSTLT
jgi:hypothetical protein